MDRQKDTDRQVVTDKQPQSLSQTQTQTHTLSHTPKHTHTLTHTHSYKYKHPNFLVVVRSSISPLFGAGSHTSITTQIRGSLEEQVFDNEREKSLL